MNDIDIESLCRWSKPKEVQTKVGPRLLRKARPTPEFYAAWGNGTKQALKAAGVSMGQDRTTGEWEALWWQKLDAAVVARREENLVLSRAADADIEIPVPEGLAYMPFQKAGISFACRCFGVDLAETVADNGLRKDRGGSGRPQTSSPVSEGIGSEEAVSAGSTWVDSCTNNPLTKKGCPSVSGGAFIADEMGL